MTGRWVPHDTRDSITDYLKYWSERTELPTKRLLTWLGLPTSKYHSWKHRYGKDNQHNGQIPRDWWIEDWEKKAIVAYHDKNPLEGYPHFCSLPTVSIDFISMSAFAAGVAFCICRF